MRNKRFYFVWAVILILGLAAITVFGLNSNSNSKVRGEKAALKINRQFVDKFFTYNSTGQRYDGIKQFMTEQGYRALFPSGIEIPKDSAVKSTATNLKAFVQKDPEAQSGQVEILNEFVVSTEYGGVESSQNVIMRSELIEEGSNWKVNDIEMIIQNDNIE